MFHRGMCSPITWIDSTARLNIDAQTDNVTRKRVTYLSLRTLMKKNVRLRFLISICPLSGRKHRCNCYTRK